MSDERRRVMRHFPGRSYPGRGERELSVAAWTGYVVLTITVGGRDVEITLEGADALALADHILASVLP